MPQPLTYLRETASQTAGPYVHIGLAPGAAGFRIFEQELGTDIAGPNAAGERITVEGLVFDGTGAAGQGRADRGLAGRTPPASTPARSTARGDGRGRLPRLGPGDLGLRHRALGFETVKPGRRARPRRPAAWRRTSTSGSSPAASTSGSAPGCTFDDEAEANAADPVLNLIEHASRRPTLIAAREERDGKPVYRFDIRLQGEGETVFFDV